MDSSARLNGGFTLVLPTRLSNWFSVRLLLRICGRHWRSPGRNASSQIARSLHYSHQPKGRIDESDRVRPELLLLVARGSRRVGPISLPRVRQREGCTPIDTFHQPGSDGLAEMLIKSATYICSSNEPDSTRTVEIWPCRIAELLRAGGSAMHRSTG